MANRKKDQLKAIGRSHVWVWIVLMCLIFVLSSIVLGIVIGMYASTLMFGKFNSEYSRVSEIAAIYENVSGSSAETADIFAGIGRNMIITDSDNNIIYESGTNTCSFKGGEVNEISFFSMFNSGYGEEDTVESYTVYEDSRSKALYVSGTTLVVDIWEIISDYGSYGIDPEILDASPEESGISNAQLEDIMLGSGIISLPYWLSIDINGGSQHFISKAYISANLNDVAVMAASLIGISALMILLFIILIVNIVNSVLKRNKILKVFFTDVATRGHNYMHFVINGGETVRRYSNHGVRYAVVDLSFVNYRFFCICHSVEEGEVMLRKVYNTIRANIDPKRELLSHCEYSEFALLLRFTDEEALKRRVTSIIEQLEKVHGEHRFIFHAGIAVLEPDGTPGKDGVPIRRKDADIELLYSNACTARDSLVENGESAVAMFDEKLIDDKKWIDAVLEHQQKALDNEEFMVYYQPKYDPRTDELRGAEALIRWQSPEFGFVPPGRIIPIFEKNGFITEIDHYMISHVARDQKMWLDRGYKCVPVSVNVSRAHFIESDLAEQIRDMIDAAGCPHELIEIELTESAFFDDKNALVSTINRLKSYGFAVSMDDFGSGYSSLNSLKDMPLDVLKLDAEFFRGENGSGRGEIVVSEAIKLAKSLNMRTVAEGVEIREQVDFLASQGCDMIQGYYYAKPMPKDEFAQRVSAGRAVVQ